MSFTISIIGRPNVGKSTLFNRLIGKKHALVDDMPGVTRDRREGKGRLASLEFNLIDTAGLEEAKDNSLENRMFLQTSKYRKTTRRSCCKVWQTILTENLFEIEQHGCWRL